MARRPTQLTTQRFAYKHARKLAFPTVLQLSCENSFFVIAFSTVLQLSCETTFSAVAFFTLC
jgi:hypothetical protein